MSDAERVSLGETLAGVNQYKVLASVMSNIDAATRAYATAVGSAGSATRENERYMSSLEARLTALRAEFQNLSTKTIESEFVGSILDAGTAVLKFAQSDIGQLVVKAGSALTAFGLLNKSLGGFPFSIVQKGFDGIRTVISVMNAGAASGVKSFSDLGTVLLGSFGSGGVIALGIAAVAAGIYGIVKAADAATVTTKELYEAADESKSKYESIKAELEGLSVREDLTEEEGRRLKILQAEYDIYKEMYEKDAQAAFESKYRGDIPSAGTTGTGAVVGSQITQGTIAKVSGAKTQTDVLEQQVNGWLNLRNQIEETKAAIDEANDPDKILELNNALEDQQDQYLEVRKQIVEIVKDYDDFIDAGGELTDQEHKLYNIMYDMVTEYQESTDAVNALVDAEEDLGEENDELEQHTADLASALFDAEGNLTDFGKKAIEAADGLKSMTKQQIEAQKAAAEANFANLIEQIHNVGAEATWTAQQIESMYLATTGNQKSARQIYEEQRSQGLTTLSPQEWMAQFGTQGAFDIYRPEIERYNQMLAQLEDEKSESSYDNTDRSYTPYTPEEKEEIVDSERDVGDRILELREKLQQEIASIEKKYREDGTIDTEYYISKLEELWEKYGAEIAEIAGSSASVIADGVGEGTEDLEQQLAEQAAQQEAQLNAAILARQAEVNAYYDAELERLEQRNEEIEKAIDLEEKLEALEKAKSQRMLVYEDGQFKWTQDYAAIAEAQKPLDEAALKQIYEDEVKRLEAERQAELERVAEEERERLRQKALAEEREREFTVEEALADIKLRSQSQGQFVVEDLAESALGEGFSGTGTGKVYADAYTRLYNEAFGTAYEAATDLYKGVYSDIYEKSGQDFSKFNEIYHSEAKAGTSFKRDPSSYTLEELPSMVALAQETVDAFGKTRFNQYSYAHSGYASGTTSATFGLHMLGEHGRELGVLSEGDGVIPNNLTENLMKLGQYSPADLVKSVKATAIGGAGATVNQNFGSVVLPNVTDATSFINEMKNFKNYATQDAYNR